MTDAGPLIVPVDVQALVIDNGNMNFLRAGMNYGQLATFQNPSPAPFQNDAGNFAANPANQGVYVMWTLPKALRHGTQQPNGPFAFPSVPNRWLVVRLFRPASSTGNAGAPAATAWVVQSDYLNAADGTSAFVDPTATSQLTPTRIGRKVQIASTAPWQEPGGGPPYFLTAVAESNPAFSAYQPFNENVFSFFDNLMTENVAAGTLSYFVMGWYSAASADVLATWQPGAKQNDFADVMAQLKWKTTTDEMPAVRSAPYTGPTTHGTLYHGGAFAVPWTPQASAPPPSPKDGVVPQVAIGNTSIDAVVAFARAAFEANPPGKLPPQQAADLLEAFQYNMLSVLGVYGAEALLEQQIRSQWFGSAQIGTQWVIVDTQIAPGKERPQPPDAAELANEAAWLSILNAAQRQFDQASRDLMAAQRQLFELWWKKGAAYLIYQQSGFVSYPWGTSAEQFDPAINDLVTRASGLAGQLKAMVDAGQVPAATDSVTLDQAIINFAQARQLPASRTLKAVADARFWAPADPVLVISNTAHMLKIDPDTSLLCRWPGELVTALAVSAGTGGGAPAFTISSTQLARYLPAVNWTNLPALAPALFAEFLLLDPANAALVAAGAGQTLSPTQLAALAESMAQPQVPAGSEALPDILAPYPWTQPWQPVYLDWDIQWLPVSFEQTNGTPNWTFNGLDYDLVPGFSQPVSNRELSGRSVLTPKPSFEFKSRIDQFITDYPESAATAELKAISDLVETVDQWDFLSQTLSGMGTWIAGCSPFATQNPDSTPLKGGGNLRELIGQAAHSPPNPVTADAPRNPTIPPSTFDAMRSGQFYINRLTIVDAFGQTLEIVLSPQPPDQFPRTASGAVFHPLLADGLTPTQPLQSLEPLRFAQLPPRLLQPSRLNFQFTPASNGNPIIGWILPNHLDSGISVYGPDGTAYGELRLGAGQSGVVWNAAPNSPYPDALPAPSPELNDLDNFLANLQALGAGALGDFLRAVDETLWSIDPLGSRADTFLSVLVGRPLAIVSASLSFELQSQAWRDTDWPYTFADPLPDPLFVGYQFPVRLGDLGFRQDGLLGYFTKGNYTNFNAIHVPDNPATTYLKAIGSGNYVNIGFAAKGPGAPAPLVLIMDPRASVHAQCGFLPVKDVTLLPQWVDGALATIDVTFRTGPILAGTQPVQPKGQTDPVTGLLWTSPAEHHGTWSWVEADGHSGWREMPLAPLDSLARFSSVPPTLREGLLKLTGGIEE